MKDSRTDAKTDQVETDPALQSIVERQDALERQMSALTAAIQSLEKRLAERGDSDQSGPCEVTVEVPVESASSAQPARRHGVRTEVKAVIAAAAAVAGEMAKVRKVRALPAQQDAGSAWSQQGRVGVVSSHRLR